MSTCSTVFARSLDATHRPARPAARLLPRVKAQLGAISLCSALFLQALATTPAQARSDVSEASALSLVPVALVIAAPLALLAGGAQLSVVGVKASAEGTVWVLERASDGAQASLKLVGQGSALVGQTVLVTAVAAGWVLSVAGAAIAFVPNELGRSLMHHERLVR